MSAILLAPAAAALVPGVLTLVGAVTQMKGDEWLYLPAGIFIFGFWSLGIGYPIAFLHMSIAWLLYRWLRRHWPLRWWIAGAAGGPIGALPVAALQGVFGDFGALELPLIFGGAGVVGGLVFRWILGAGEWEAAPA